MIPTTFSCHFTAAAKSPGLGAGSRQGSQGAGVLPVRELAAAGGRGDRELAVAVSVSGQVALIHADAKWACTKSG